jgi:adenine phosphoribosyltransferase
MKACCELVEHLGGTVAGCAVLIELVGLKGRDKLTPYPIHAVVRYD